MTRKVRDEKLTPLLDAKQHAQGFLQVREAHRRELMDDYVELIADLIREFGEARQVDLAERLGVSQPTVAKTLKRLAATGLVRQLPYRGTFLTPEGEQLAAQNRERHNIVESFFIALGVSAQTARLDAEGVEHHVSDETLEAFRCFTRQRNSGK